MTQPSQSDNSNNDDFGDMAEYIQVFIDESTEELDHLVEAILVLEKDPSNTSALQSAFRMLHSLKGSCGMMGFEAAGNFAHQLEDQFESYRSGVKVINREATTLMLRSIDFFRDFVTRLRQGERPDHAPTDLIEAWKRLDFNDQTPTSSRENRPTDAKSLGAIPAFSISGGVRLVVTFRDGLPLADLKARLIVNKLSAIGEVIDCDPPIDEAGSFDDLRIFSLTLVTSHSIEDVRRTVKVDGVESIDIQGGQAIPFPQARTNLEKPTTKTPSAGTPLPTPAPAQVATPAPATAAAPATPSGSEGADAAPPGDRGIKESSNQTIRVETERLDQLMNLTGELVIADARFSQISDSLQSIFASRSTSSHGRDLVQRLRFRLDEFRKSASSPAESESLVRQFLEGIDDELDLLEQQGDHWNEGCQRFDEIQDAVDQLGRISKNLQRCVLKTRMVSVAPLFNRFKRVVRDLSVEHGKQVKLEISGEKTELDKQMIDALGEPLLHLVRNCVDHGIESSEQRRLAGKPPTGTISMEASQRGNNVFIRISDDGGGIRVDKIRDKAVRLGLVPNSKIAELSEPEILDFIWEPGFSTADRITETSGRGVGMDIVRDAITRLNGTISLASIEGTETIFTIRLPLTLAIIHSLVVRVRGTLFSVPMDDVREIVSIHPQQVFRVQHSNAIEVRNRVMPLRRLDEVLSWNTTSPQASDRVAEENRSAASHCNVILLEVRNRIVGLVVDELVGRSDIVIKSLSENFRPVKGLSGASITGDGEVCLMLDPLVILDPSSDTIGR
jgi:two-component system, chemotaxis family, sensor kinase CheA